MPDTPTEAAPTATADVRTEAAFFSVSVTKLVVLSICTLGAYELFWFYGNWRAIRARDRSAISPIWRTYFAFFFAYDLFKRVRDFPARSAGASPLSAGPMAAGWIITSLCVYLPDPYWVVTFVSFVFLVPVQRVATRANDAVAPERERNSAFTAVNWLTIVVGGLLIALGFIGWPLTEP